MLVPETELLVERGLDVTGGMVDIGERVEERAGGLVSGESGILPSR